MTEAINQQKKYEEYNETFLQGGQSVYKFNLITSPLEKTVADFKGTLAPYDCKNNDKFFLSSTSNVLSDFAQPLYGLANIASGAVMLVISLIRNLFIGFELVVRCLILKHNVSDVLFYKPSGAAVLSKKNSQLLLGDIFPLILDSAKIGNIYSTQVALEYLLRGVLQIITTPLQYGIRMPLRGLITYHLKNGMEPTLATTTFEADINEQQNEQQEIDEKKRGSDWWGASVWARPISTNTQKDRLDLDAVAERLKPYKPNITEETNNQGSETNSIINLIRSIFMGGN